MIRTPSRKLGSRSVVAKPATIGKVAAGSREKPHSLARFSWSLPSGESLAEFALRFGFVAPPLLGSSEAGFPRRRNRRGR
jgi:hypothetical protein